MINCINPMCQTGSKKNRNLYAVPCLNAVFLFTFFLLFLCACEQDKKQYNSGRESNLTPDFPMPVICDDVFPEIEQLSTPEEFIERFGNLSPENTWYLHPESKLSNGLLYWCQYKVGDDIVFPKCGMLIMFETNGIMFSFDSWTVHLQDMNIQSCFLPMEELKGKMPLGSTCQHVRNLLGYPCDISYGLPVETASERRLYYTYHYFPDQIGMYTEQFIRIRLSCEFVDQKLSSVQMQFLKDNSFEALLLEEFVEKY